MHHSLLNSRAERKIYNDTNKELYASTYKKIYQRFSYESFYNLFDRVEHLEGKVFRNPQAHSGTYNIESRKARITASFMKPAGQSGSLHENDDAIAELREQFFVQKEKNREHKQSIKKLV
jgi:hypothetical protein